MFPKSEIGKVFKKAEKVVFFALMVFLVIIVIIQQVEIARLEEKLSALLAAPVPTVAENTTGRHWFQLIPSGLLNRTDVIAYPEQTADYIVFTDGQKCYAKNGRTGQIEFSGADATSVIQTAINRVASLSGGTVFIKSGTYVVDTILIQGASNVRILGEGWSTKLVAKGPDTIVFKIGDRSDKSKVSSNIEVAYLYIGGSNQATETDYPENNDRRFGIEVASPDGSANGIELHHLYIYNTGSDSIYIYGPADVLVAYNVIKGTRGYWASIHEHGAVVPSYPLPAHKSTVAFNVIVNSQVGAIRHARLIIGNKIINCSGTEYGGLFKATLVGGDNSAIIGNYIEGTPSDVYGIKSWRMNNIIMGNTVIHTGRYGIALITNQARIIPVFSHIVEGNCLLYTGGGIYLGYGNMNTIVRNNVIERPTGSGIVLLSAGVNDCIIEGNIIIDPAYQYNGYDGSGVIINGQRNVIRGNKLIVTDTTNIRPVSFINEASGDYNVIELNYFPIGVTYRTAPLVKTGAHTIVRRNINYLTENSGVATISAGSTRVTVSHGLATTPSKVLITPLAQPSGKLWVENITSTSFDIVTDTAPSSNLNVSWYAEG
jgi:hypothetical protein